MFEQHIYYTILGHSEIKTPTVEQIPYNIILVLPSKCGRDFARNHEFTPIFKNMNKIKNYVGKEQVFASGKNYANQVISLGSTAVTNKLKHGVYSLPTNLVNRNTEPVLYASEAKAKANAIARETNVRMRNHLFTTPVKYSLSKILQDISHKIGPRKVGIVIGLFCRGIGGISVVNAGNKQTYPILISDPGKRNRVLSVNYQKTVRHKLRPSTTKSINTKFKERAAIKRLIPRPTGSFKPKRGVAHLFKSFFRRRTLPS